jgi:hypothetical protein
MVSVRFYPPKGILWEAESPHALIGDHALAALNR